MKRVFVLMSVAFLTIGLVGCGVNEECDEPLLDYNQNGEEGDAGDYDIMRAVEDECMEGY